MSAVQEHEQRPDGEHRIVVGIDGSSASLRALDWAARQAEVTRSVLEVIVTWDWPVSLGWAPMGDYNPSTDAQHVLDDSVAEVRSAHPALDVRSIVMKGHPAVDLVEASWDADLLVVGSRGHGEFSGMLLGSVSLHCVSNSHCPVVVVRDGLEPDPASTS
jgi:nucleotide-binding universal stress UspA family protein